MKFLTKRQFVSVLKTILPKLQQFFIHISFRLNFGRTGIVFTFWWPNLSPFFFIGFVRKNSGPRQGYGVAVIN